MVFGILIATGLFYMIFADGKIQRWNDPNAVANKIYNTEADEVELSFEVKENFVKNL